MLIICSGKVSCFYAFSVIHGKNFTIALPQYLFTGKIANKSVITMEIYHYNHLKL